MGLGLGALTSGAAPSLARPPTRPTELRQGRELAFLTACPKSRHGGDYSRVLTRVHVDYAGIDGPAHRRLLPRTTYA